MTMKRGSKGWKRDGIVQKVARITGYSERYIRMVRQMQRTNDQILTALIEVQQRESKLIEEVRRIVPIEGRIKRKMSEKTP